MRTQASFGQRSTMATPSKQTAFSIKEKIAGAAIPTTFFRSGRSVPNVHRLLPRKHQNNDQYNRTQQFQSKDPQAISIVHLDSSQLIKNGTNQQPRKASAKATSHHRYMPQGPIKRLKSAIIRSVFTRPEKTENDTFLQNQSYYQRETNGAQAERQSKQTSQMSDLNQVMIGSNKGEQCNLPTYVITTPHLYNTSFNQQDFPNVSAWQQNGFTNDDLSPTIIQDLQPESPKIATITTDGGGIIARMPTGTVLTGGHSTITADQYQKLLINSVQVESAEEPSSNILTPENEHALTMMGHFGLDENGRGVSPVRNQATNLIFTTGENSKKRGMSLAFTSAERKVSAKNLPRSNYELAQQLRSRDENEAAVNQSNDQQNTASGSQIGGHARRQIVTNLSEIQLQGNHSCAILGVVTEAQHEAINNLADDNQNSPSGQVTRPQNEHQLHEYAKIFMERNKSIVQVLRPSLNAQQQTQKHLSSGGISTLNGFVSLKDLVVDQQPSAAQQQQKSMFIQRTELSSEKTIMQNSPHHDNVSQRKSNSVLSFRANQLHSHMRNLSSPDQIQKAINKDGDTLDFAQHDVQVPATQPKYDKASISNEKPLSPSRFARNQALEVYSPPKKLQDPHMAASIIPRDTSTPHSQQQLSNEDKLRTAEFRSFESFEEVGYQHLQLEIARRDDLLLRNLKQQIDEDHNAMYDLLQGIQSGMVKLDPCSMNKAIITKIKQLNERQNPDLQQMVPRQQGPAVIEIRREVENGLREMADLDRTLKERANSSTRMLLSNESQHDYALMKEPNNQTALIVKLNKEVASRISGQGSSITRLLDSRGISRQTKMPLSTALLTDVPLQQPLPQESIIEHATPARIDEGLIRNSDNPFHLRDLAKEGTDYRNARNEYSTVQKSNVSHEESSQNRLAGAKDSYSQEIAIRLTRLQPQESVIQSVEADSTPKGAMLDHRLASFDHHQSNRDLEVVNNSNLATVQHLVQPKMLQVSSSTFNPTATLKQPAGAQKTSLKSAVDRSVRALTPGVTMNVALMDELRRLQDSRAQPRDGTGVMAASWLNNHINERKPVKKFINLNDQTRFAKLQPSLLQKKSISQLTNSTRQQYLENNQMYRQIARSVADRQHQTTNQSIPQSYGTLSTKFAAIKCLRGQVPRITRPQTSQMVRNEMRHPTLMMHVATANENETVIQQEMVMFDVHPPSHHNYEQFKVRKTSYDQMTSSVTISPLGQQQLRDQPPAPVLNQRSGSCFSHFVEKENSRERQLASSQKELKGIQGQLASFQEIDIMKLTSDKALNRHITGQQQDGGASIDYDNIRQQALAQSSSRQSVITMREKSMIPQANQIKRQLNRHKNVSPYQLRGDEFQQKEELLRASNEVAQNISQGRNISSLSMQVIKQNSILQRQQQQQKAGKFETQNSAKSLYRQQHGHMEVDSYTPIDRH